MRYKILITFGSNKVLNPNKLVMEKLTVNTDYSKEPDEELAVFAEIVYKALNPNTNFTWKADVMTSFRTKIDTYKDKLVEARSGGTPKKAAKNAAKKDLTNDMSGIADEVNHQSDGNEVKLRSSGFVMSKTKTKKGTLPPPKRLTVKTGLNSGDLFCSVEANTDADRYNFYTHPVPEPENMDEWRLTSSSKHTKNISGFKRGTEYAVRCAYQGTSDTLVFSDTVHIFAQ